MKPMLAGKIEKLTDVQFPVMVSPKLDGIRAIVRGGKLLSRKLEPIPNCYLQKKFGRRELEGFDGELIMGDPCAKNAFQATASAVMSTDGTPSAVKFHVFDHISAHLYTLRHAWLELRVPSCPVGEVVLVPQQKIHSVEELEKVEARYLSAGYEGVMVRVLDGLYKHGRSTLREGYLLKIKRFQDSEAEVLGFEEQQANENELQMDKLGHAKRSHAKEGKVGKDTLGRFLVRDVKTGVEFRIGTGRGLTAALRQEIWNNQKKYRGKVVRYRYQEVGTKDKPRLPIFDGFRDRRDMD